MSRTIQYLVNSPKIFETISIFWSLIFQDLVPMVLKFWKVKYLYIIIKKHLILQGMIIERDLVEAKFVQVNHGGIKFLKVLVVDWEYQV